MTAQDELRKSWISGELHVYLLFLLSTSNWYSRPSTYSVQFSALVTVQLSGGNTLAKYLEGRISVRVLSEFLAHTMRAH